MSNKKYVDVTERIFKDRELTKEEYAIDKLMREKPCYRKKVKSKRWIQTKSR